MKGSVMDACVSKWTLGTTYSGSAEHSTLVVVLLQNCAGEQLIHLNPSCAGACSYRRMSEAIEGAELMLYGISAKYKESANCRMVSHAIH
jgi:hypothetical protein